MFGEYAMMNGVLCLKKKLNIVKAKQKKKIVMNDSRKYSQDTLYMWENVGKKREKKRIFLWLKT